MKIQTIKIIEKSRKIGNTETSPMTDELKAWFEFTKRVFDRKADNAEDHYSS
jgi:hypothetical protein